MLFWIFLPQFMIDRCSLLSDSSPVKDFMPFWHHQIAPPLLKSILAERRVELLGILADEYRVHRLAYPSNFTSVCQDLLYEAATRFQHARLRQISLIRYATANIRREQFDLCNTETAACAAVCRASGLRALATLADKMVLDSNIERVAKTRVEWEDLGHYQYASAADWYQI
jgi:hypothetical protein